MDWERGSDSKLVNSSTPKTEREAISMEDFQDILANLDKLQPQDRRLMALLMLTGACGSNRIRTYDLPGMNRGGTR